MSAPRRHSHGRVTSAITLSELRLQRQTEEFDDPFTIDDDGGQQYCIFTRRRPR